MISVFSNKPFVTNCIISNKTHTVNNAGSLFYKIFGVFLLKNRNYVLFAQKTHFQYVNCAILKNQKQK